MKTAALLLLFSIFHIQLFAQIKTSIHAGPLFATGKYGGDWKNTFATNKNTGWAVSTSIEIPIAKKVFFNTAVEVANKKFTYKMPPPTLFTFQRTEQCTYLSIKPSVQVLVIKHHAFSVTAGAGFFAGIALGGKYTETADSVWGSPTNVSGKLKIGNTTGNSYKKTDAGISLQITGRYKKFIIPLMADFSFTSNIPNQYSTDPYGMPMATASTRKWRSLYAGIGYSFPLNKRK
jgi:hypothetical protein